MIKEISNLSNNQNISCSSVAYTTESPYFESPTVFLYQGSIGLLYIGELLMLGPLNYFVSVFIPSAAGMSKREYFYRPWEVFASYFGGDKTYDYTIYDVAGAVGHTVSALFFGPISWIFGLW